MNDILIFMGKHWVDFGVGWLILIKWMTVIQDAVNAEPSGLKPPFGKIIYYMNAITGAVLAGKRPQTIGGINALSSSSTVDSVSVSK